MAVKVVEGLVVGLVAVEREAVVRVAAMVAAMEGVKVGD